MKNTLYTLLGAAVLATTSGCIVVPARPGYVEGSAVVYVAPTYESPGPGWAWQHHSSSGWGWRHREHGWHRGWR